MVCISNKSKRRISAAIAAGVILSATCVVVAFPRSAAAEDHRGGGWHRGGDRHRGGGYRGGYYAAPPVVYGSPYYAPPVVYGSPFGLNINIR